MYKCGEKKKDIDRIDSVCFGIDSFFGGFLGDGWEKPDYGLSKLSFERYSWENL